MSDFVSSLDVIYSYLTSLAIAISRTFALFSILPIMTRLGLPRFIQVVIIIALCIPIVTPISVQIRSLQPYSPFFAGALCLKEAFLGLLIGFVIGIPFWVMEVAGNITDFIRQAPDALVQDPQSTTEATITGTLFSIFATLYFIAMDGLTVIVDIIYKSYELWPALNGWPELNENSTIKIVEILDGLFRASLLIAGPLLIFVMTAFLLVAVISRFITQVNVFDLSMSSRNIAFLIAIQIYAIYIISYFATQSTHIKETLDIVKGILSEP